MYGAILGDMIGAPYEFDRGNKTKDFPLFSRGSQFTDDSVMTIAVAEALMCLDGEADDDAVHHAVSKAMRTWGRNYPDAGYGGRFRSWLFTHRKPKPYGSWGNGSAMRVSSVGWLYDTIEETRRFAKLTAEVTHNHPEGIKGAEATASAIFMARTGAKKMRSESISFRNLAMTCQEPAMKSDRNIIMWKAVRRQFRRQSRHSWKEMILKMSFRQRCLLVVTVIL